jgi:aspartate racemase
VSRSVNSESSVGLIGGVGPESTIDYYKRILEAWDREQPGSAPSIVIDSLDVQTAIRLVQSDRAALVEYLLQSVERLAGAGVNFVAMTANTAHLVFDQVAERSAVPLLSIVEACADAALARGLRRLALLGTRFTMEAAFYPDVCARRGIAVVLPNEEERAWIHQAYLGELLRGDFRDDTRQRFTSIVERLRNAEAIDGVILGGTELPLLLTTAAIAGVPALDTTAVHVAAIVERLRKTSQPSSGGTARNSRVLSVYERLLGAWNRRDADAFARVFTPHGSTVGFDGSQMNGREEIAATLRAIFSDHQTAAYVAKVREIRPMGNAMWLLRAVVGMIPPGKSELNPAANAVQSLVIIDDGSDATIALLQNTPAAFHGRPHLAEALTAELTEVFVRGELVANDR